MNDKNCGNCKFSANFVREENVGTCRFYPPTVMYQPMPAVNLAGEKQINWGQQASAHPMVARGGWCGQHQDAPPSIFNS